MNCIACSVFLLFYPKGGMCSTQDTATSQAILLNISSSVLSTTLSDGCNIVGRLFQDGRNANSFRRSHPSKFSLSWLCFGFLSLVLPISFIFAMHFHVLERLH
ncbi:hypothetical protein B0H13DRAFT_1946772, partial [Mycena leptocephala]